MATPVIRTEFEVNEESSYLADGGAAWALMMTRWDATDPTNQHIVDMTEVKIRVDDRQLIVHIDHPNTEATDLMLAWHPPR